MTDAIRKEINEALTKIEDRIDLESSAGTRMRMPARNFMFFLVSGGQENSLRVLSRKVRGLLSNPDACEFIRLDEEEEEKKIGARIEDALLDAARRFVNVRDLNRIYLFPVFFTDTEISENVKQKLDDIDRYMEISDRQPVWQPFLITAKEVSQYAGTYRAFCFMEEFIRKHLQKVAVNRCCVLSNVSGDGFAVSEESLLQTVAMTAVIQNVSSRSGDALQAVGSRVTISDNEPYPGRLFFTSRCATIRNPKQKYLMQRILHVFDFFSGATDSSAGNVFDLINYEELSSLLKEYLDRLPKMNGVVTLYPLYGVMNGPDCRQQLQKIYDEYYRQPLFGANTGNQLQKQVREWFFRQYFEHNGSLRELKESIETNRIREEMDKAQRRCALNVPIDDIPANNRKLAPFYSGIYGQAAQECRNMINGFAGSVLRNMGSNFSDEALKQHLDNCLDFLEEIKTEAREHLRVLGRTDIALSIGQTETRAGEEDVQEGWVQDTAAMMPGFRQLNSRFDFYIYQMLAQGVMNAEELLNVCYEAVRDSAYSDREYMNNLSAECADDERAGEYIESMSRNLNFTVRLLNSREEENSMCIVGDPDHRLCRKLQERLHGIAFSFPEFDRIDVLHISSAFPAENMREWEKLKQIGGEVTL